MWAHRNTQRLFSRVNNLTKPVFHLALNKQARPTVSLWGRHFGFSRFIIIIILTLLALWLLFSLQLLKGLVRLFSRPTLGAHAHLEEQ